MSTTSILISSEWSKRLRSDGLGGLSLTQPPNGARDPLAKSLTYYGEFRGFSGTHSTAEWRIQLSWLVDMTSGYQFSRPEWYPISASELGVTVTGCEIEPDGRILVASSTGGTQTPKAFRITIPMEGLVDVRTTTTITTTGATAPVSILTSFMRRAEF